MAEGGMVEEALISFRVAGAWTGIVQASPGWSVARLRAEASRCSGFPAHTINLIAAGRNLKDEDSLKDLRLHKLLMTRIKLQEAERADRLARIRAAAEAMSSRGEDGQFSSLDHYDVSLTDQNGKNLHFETDSVRRALIMGLILHGKARKLIVQRHYKEALQLLIYAEESFSLCDKSLLESVDNVAYVQIDIVWCLFNLSDIGGLEIARRRLKEARQGLKIAHGYDLSRLKLLQGIKRGPPMYVRLTLLEGVVAFHTGENSAGDTLTDAQFLLEEFLIPDESIAVLVGMGFHAEEAKRALKVSQKDVDSAAAFILEQRERRQKRRAEDEQYRKNRRELKKYGQTKSGKAVDLTQLNELAAMGFAKPLVAEVLKQTDNDTNAALDILSDPVRLEALRCSTKRLRITANQTHLNDLMEMGFSQEQATLALQSSTSMGEALEKLVSNQDASFPSCSSAEPARLEDNTMDVSVDDDQKAKTDDRDTEMEDEIADVISGDPLEEFDLDLELEAAAIKKYLDMIFEPGDRYREARQESTNEEP